jgi:serine/threonine protein kinase
MKFMNQHNVVHRDLKIENILVKTKQGSSKKESFEDFEFKVADLGLAKAVTSHEDMIKTLCGTPVCMAPEIVAGRFYNYKVDVWSVGTLLFHLLTGTYPFKGRSIEELKQNL